jgi:hypothetical protein
LYREVLLAASMAEQAFALRALKLVVRFLGGLACIAFAVLTCRRWAEPKVEDFWEFCHWLGQTMLGVFVGVGGCYAEIRGSMSSVTRHFRRFALNRIGLSIFYFWLGCYVMGGEITGAGIWTTVSHVTGVVAWIAAVGDLLVSCCSDRHREEEEEAELSPSRKDAEQAAPAHPVTLGRAGSSVKAQPAVAAHSADSRSAGSAGPDKDPGLQLSSIESPAGGWASSGKQFGSL